MVGCGWDSIRVLRLYRKVESMESTVRRRHNFLGSPGCRCSDDGIAKPHGLGDSLHNCRARISGKLRSCQTILGPRVRLDNIGDCPLCWSRKLHSLKSLSRLPHLSYRTRRVSIRRWSCGNLGISSRILSFSGRRYPNLVRSHLPPDISSAERSRCPIYGFFGSKVLF
jgi:hypothetical protein